MPDLYLNVQEVDAGVQSLTQTAQTLDAYGSLSELTSLLNFSPVSGLDFAGRTHGTISENYQPVSTQALASHIRDAATLLESNLANAVTTDSAFSNAVSRIGAGDSLGWGSLSEAMQQGVPTPALVNATTGRFANAAPVAGPQSSLPGLNNMFASTFPDQAMAAANDWALMSDQLTQTVSALDDAKASLASSSTTSWVQAAVSRINQIQWAGGTYAAHASALSGHTTNLATVAQANQVSTAVAHGTWLMLPTMEQKLAFERAFLAPFAPNLTTGLVPSNPVFNQLLPPLSDMPGDDYKPQAISVPQAPAFEKTPLPKIVAQALSERGFADLARASTPAEIVQQFEAITPDTLGALSEGATATQAAAVTAPTMPPTLNPGAGLGAQAFPGLGTAPVTGGTGVGMPGAVGFTPGASRPASANLAAAGIMPRGGAGTGWSGGFPGAGIAGAFAGRGPGAGFGNPVGASGTGGFPGVAGARGSGSAPRVGGVPGAGIGSVGAGGIGSAPGVGTGGSGVGASSRGAGLPGAPGSAGAGSSNARAFPVGGPAGATGRGADRDRKPNRVKAVTSAVERDGNLRALLGEAPALLPDVIGENVKEPRDI